MPRRYRGRRSNPNGPWPGGRAATYADLHPALPTNPDAYAGPALYGDYGAGTYVPPNDPMAQPQPWNPGPPRTGPADIPAWDLGHGYTGDEGTYAGMPPSLIAANYRLPADFDATYNAGFGQFIDSGPASYASSPAAGGNNGGYPAPGSGTYPSFDRSLLDKFGTFMADRWLNNVPAGKLVNWLFDPRGDRTNAAANRLPWNNTDDWRENALGGSARTGPADVAMGDNNNDPNADLVRIERDPNMVALRDLTGGDGGGRAGGVAGAGPGGGGGVGYGPMNSALSYWARVFPSSALGQFAGTAPGNAWGVQSGSSAPMTQAQQAAAHLAGLIAGQNMGILGELGGVPADLQGQNYV